MAATNLKKFFNVFKLTLPGYLVDQDVKVNEPHLIACLVYTNKQNTIVFELIVPAEYADLVSQDITSPDHHAGDLARKPIWGLTVADLVGEDSELRNSDGLNAFECGCGSCVRVLSKGSKKLIRVTVSCGGAPLRLEAYHFDADEDASMMSVLVSMQTPVFKRVEITYDSPINYTFSTVMNHTQRENKMTSPQRGGVGDSRVANNSSAIEPITLSSDDDDIVMMDPQSISEQAHAATRTKSPQPASSAPPTIDDDFTDACRSVLHRSVQLQNDDGASRSRDTPTVNDADCAQVRSDRQYSFARAMQDHVTLLDWLQLHRYAMERLDTLQQARESDSATDPPRVATEGDA